MLDSVSFPAKILLFGEYSVIRQSKGLAIPYELFEGRLLFPKDKKRIPDNELQALATYLSRKIKKEELSFEFDIRSFNFDVSGGLRFESSIPQGYGAGSSGALCAAIFNQYAKLSLEQKNDILYLKKCLSEIESHFHGSSSGVDPLISYLKKPLLIDANQALENVVMPELAGSSGGGIFLLNTGRSRRTEPLVNLFLEKCSSKDFSYLCDRVLTPISDDCIDALLEQDIPRLLKSFKDLSRFQMENFESMIPPLFRDIWMRGLEEDSFYLKLCGAGGGGFLLGVTTSFKNLPEEFSDLNIRPVLEF
ncbi:MAG: mevalonate kinase [Bdellovibrionota bacterium]|nr:mevalonate kinase [Bdellovibrionota bacterium]